MRPHTPKLKVDEMPVLRDPWHRVYWGSHGCYLPPGHTEPCACACCECADHERDHEALGCVARWPWYGPDTHFTGEDQPVTKQPSAMAERGPSYKFKMFGTIDTENWPEIEHDEVRWLLEGLVTAPDENEAFALLNEYATEMSGARVDGIDLDEYTPKGS